MPANSKLDELFKEESDSKFSISMIKTLECELLFELFLIYSFRGDCVILQQDKISKRYTSYLGKVSRNANLIPLSKPITINYVEIENQEYSFHMSDVIKSLAL